MSTPELARSDATTLQHPRTRSTTARRSVLLSALLALAVLLAVGCDATEANTDYSFVNALRSRNGLAPLARSGELDAKARTLAAQMAASGTLFHSTLSAGVTPGWRAIGENVAYAGSIIGAQWALEGSPPHMANLLNPAFTEIGVGVKTSNGLVYVVQVFVGR